MKKKQMSKYSHVRNRPILRSNVFFRNIVQYINISSLTGHEAVLPAVVVCALLRVQRQQLLLPKLGHPEAPAATQSEQPSLPGVRPVHVASVDEPGDLVDLLASAQPALRVARRHRTDELHAGLPEAPVDRVGGRYLHRVALRVAQLAVEGADATGGAAQDVVSVLPLRERRVGDVVVKELSPLHEHEGVLPARVVAVGDEGGAEGAR